MNVIGLCRSILVWAYGILANTYFTIGSHNISLWHVMGFVFGCGIFNYVIRTLQGD